MDPKNPAPEKIRQEIALRLFGRRDASWRAIQGGLSRSEVWRVSRGDDAFAVKRAHDEAVAVRPVWAGRVLTRARDAGLPFVAAQPPGDWPVGVSGSWYSASDWRPGRPVSETPDETTATMAALAGLARFHQTVAASGVRVGAAADPLAGLRQRLDRFELSGAASRLAGEEIERLGSRLPGAVRAARDLIRTLPGRVGGLQPIHGDARPEHFLISQGELTGLIDFEAMRVGLPEEDVARFAGEIALGDAQRRDALVALYAQAAGRAVDPHLIAVLDGAKAAIAAINWTRWLSEPGFGSSDWALIRPRLRAILARLPGGRRSG